MPTGRPAAGKFKGEAVFYVNTRTDAWETLRGKALIAW